MSGERDARSEGSAVGKATRSLVGRLVEVQRKSLNRPDVGREPKDGVYGAVAMFGAFQNLNYQPGYAAFLDDTRYMRVSVPDHSITKLAHTLSYIFDKIVPRNFKTDSRQTNIMKENTDSSCLLF